jgi:hypothetical protein
MSSLKITDYYIEQVKISRAKEYCQQNQIDLYSILVSILGWICIANFC